MIGRRRDSLGELVRTQHEETMVYLREHAEEVRSWQERREEEMQEWSERRDERFERQAEEMREFNREILLRNEKVYTAMILQLEENTAQTRANTKAVLSVLDRLDGPGDIAA